MRFQRKVIGAMLPAGSLRMAMEGGGIWNGKTLAKP
jgi:hypothetical protein